MRYLKRLVFKIPCLWKFCLALRKKKGELSISSKGLYRINKEIIGSGHSLIIGDNTILNDTVIHMTGRNNKIIIGSNCIIGQGCSFWCEGVNAVIEIGDNTTFTRDIHLNAQEDNKKIAIGNDCMFSNTIIIRTSDSHPIYDNQGNRINFADDVIIGNHVWIAPNSKVMKGSIIGDGSIIGSDTMVTKTLPNNCLAVGHPARIVKSDISWSREDVVLKNV